MILDQAGEESREVIEESVHVSLSVEGGRVLKAKIQTLVRILKSLESKLAGGWDIVVDDEMDIKVLCGETRHLTVHLVVDNDLGDGEDAVALWKVDGLNDGIERNIAVLNGLNCSGLGGGWEVKESVFELE